MTAEIFRLNLLALLFVGAGLTLGNSTEAYAAPEAAPADFQVRPLRLKPGVGQGKLRINEDMKRRLEATIVRNGLAVSFSDIVCGDMKTEDCFEQTRSLDPSLHPTRASLNLDSWAESASEIDRALLEFTSERNDRQAERAANRLDLKKAAVLIRLVVGKIQEQIDLNPEPLVPESLRDLASSAGVRSLELHHNIILFRDRVVLASIAVNRTAPDYKLHRPLLALAPVEIKLNGEQNELGKAVQWAVQQSIEEFGRQLPSQLRK